MTPITNNILLYHMVITYNHGAWFWPRSWSWARRF